MKILHVITQLELGGAQKNTLELLAHLDRKVFSPSLASSEGELTQAALQIPDLSVTFFDSMRSAIDPVSLMFDLINFRKLVSFIRRERFHVVHTHSSKAGILARWAARIAGVPLIIHTVHGFGFHDFQAPWLKGLYQRLERITANITDHLIVVSEHDMKLGLKLGIGDPKQYSLIRYGIENSTFSTRMTKGEARRALGLKEEAPVIGTIACLKPQKGPLDFAKTCSLIAKREPRAQFVIAGDGKMRRALERWRTKLGLEDSLHILGWRKDIPRILTALDVFVLASKWEGLPIACIEAMAAGLPVVATRAGGIPELICHGKNGLLVPIAQPEALAESALIILKDPDLSFSMGHLNRISALKKFSIERMTARIADIYTQSFAQRVA